MSWTQTHERWQALNDAEAALVAAAHTAVHAVVLPWSETHADLFGDRDGLVAALRHRFDLRRQAQELDLPLHLQRREQIVLRALDRLTEVHRVAS